MPIPFSIDGLIGAGIEGIIGSLGIRGRTQHFSESEAVARGNQVGIEVQRTLESVYSQSDLARVYPIYRARLLAYLPAAAQTLWGQSRVRFAVDWINNNTSSTLPSTWTAGRGIFALAHIGAVWILLNMDMESPDEFQNTFMTVINGTLVPAFVEAGITPPAGSASGGVIVPSGTVAAGLVGNKWVKWALGLGILGALIYALFVKKG